MSIKVALHHRTTYKYDRPVTLGPHVVRLRPAPHTRTPILSYSQKIKPAEHFLNWQQDPWANWLGRLVFPEKTQLLEVEIDLVADMVAINPFDFFLEEHAQETGFAYGNELSGDLKPYLTPDLLTPLLKDFLTGAPKHNGATNDFMVSLNQYVEQEIGYIIRMEPGVQTPETTLRRKKGSCRDSAWLLIQMLRHFGYAARFVSGYLIQLTADLKPVSGPEGPTEDFTDLHAWAEVYLPGAGWVGLDPTSGLFAGEGHIPLAAAPAPQAAAPITGALEKCEVEFDHDMLVTRLVDPPRSTKPLDEQQWSAIVGTAKAVDERLKKNDVRLTVGGEPTFVSATDRDADEWTTAAVGPTKRDFADRLIRRLRDRFAPGGVLHYGQGKWYPGEQLPRWSFELHWRGDGVPLWQDADLIAREGQGEADMVDAERFIKTLCGRLNVDPEHAQPAFEDPVEFTLREQNLPINRIPENNELSDPEARRRMVRVFQKDLTAPRAFVLPIQQAQTQAKHGRSVWMTELWKTRRGRIFLIPGDSAAGLRLPLESLPWLPKGMRPVVYPVDHVGRPLHLPARTITPPTQQQRLAAGKVDFEAAHKAATERAEGSKSGEDDLDYENLGSEVLGGAVRTAMVVEPRDGRLCVFLPPVGALDDYVVLLGEIEATAAALDLPIHVEGYTPPSDGRLNVIKVTPDPGVIEVNIHPANSWEEQEKINTALYDEARAIGLDSQSFLIDGRPTGSGGGNHVVMGGAYPSDSPFLRRPDLLASVIRYWQNHPSLSYFFSGLFIGPTSQAPRIDESRHDSLFELELAMEQLPAPPNAPAWLMDRLFRDLLTDATGNTHRTEICIDKLFSPDGPAGRLGLVEFRAFEMPPHSRMAAVQSLILRALIVWFWERPYTAPLTRFGTALHDRFMLPHYVEEDFQSVLDDLSEGLGLSFDNAWFQAQRDLRFPEAGRFTVSDTEVILQHALEPWPVLGEDGAIGGTTRFVDSSLERMQVTVRGLQTGHALACNGVQVPLQKVAKDTWIAGVRFRAWLPARCLHPTIQPHAPLQFDVFDKAWSRSLGGGTYHAVHPGGRNHEHRPINALEAEGRRLARFARHHTPGSMTMRQPVMSPEFPMTLDLRWS